MHLWYWVKLSVTHIRGLSVSWELLYWYMQRNDSADQWLILISYPHFSFMKSQYVKWKLITHFLWVVPFFVCLFSLFSLVSVWRCCAAALRCLKWACLCFVRSFQQNGVRRSSEDGLLPPRLLRVTSLPSALGNNINLAPESLRMLLCFCCWFAALCKLPLHSPSPCFSLLQLFPPPLLTFNFLFCFIFSFSSVLPPVSSVLLWHSLYADFTPPLITSVTFFLFNFDSRDAPFFAGWNRCVWVWVETSGWDGCLLLHNQTSTNLLGF